MTKYSKELKLKAVLSYLDSEDSFRTIAERFGVSITPLKGWVAQYKEQGAEGMHSPYTSYDLQFKMDVLNYMSDLGATANQAAAKFNIHSPATVHKWDTLAKEFGMDALKSKKKGRSSMKKANKKTAGRSSTEALETELKRLRMENAYLKKLNALVQNKEKLQNKTKRK